MSKVQRASTSALMEKLEKEDMANKKSKTWDEKIYQELDVDQKDVQENKKNKPPKSLVNFQEYMDSEEKKHLQNKTP